MHTFEIWLTRLGSAWFSLFIISLLLICTTLILVEVDRAGALVSFPFALFVLNLGAAIFSRPTFRCQISLLMFHLALLAIVVLVALGRLTYLKGTVELTQGNWFDGRLLEEDSGPWHRNNLQDARFINKGFVIEYSKEIQRGHTYNEVGWIDRNSVEQSSIIGDQQPLILEGYRFYTSFNKGFAPVLEWENQTGLQSGAVHLPSYPSLEFEQAQYWQPPGASSQLWIALDFDEVILDDAKPSLWRPPEKYRLVIREGENRYTLRPNQSVTLAEGKLTLIGLRSWMGYNIFYDWTLPWLLAASLVAVLSLGHFYYLRFSSKHWHQDQITEPQADEK